MKSLILATLISASAFAQSQKFLDEPWQGFSEPDVVGSGFTHNLKDLPMSGFAHMGTRNWSSTYWPSNKGSIANRWNSPNHETFDYPSPSKAQVMSMTPEALAMLSPAEKFDLFNGNYDYPLKREVYTSADKHAKSWAGICHGWTPAAINHNEPTPKMVKNPDGIMIPFGSSDIKAIISYYYAFYTEDQETNQVGLRCFFGGWLGGLKGCDQDLNAGAFHIVLTNKLGLQNESFIADVDRFSEIWNQPIVGYKSTFLQNLPRSDKAAKSAVREIRVETEFSYVDETDPSWNVVEGTEQQKIGVKTYQYRLEINAQGQIVGGTWESKERPDFIWRKHRVESFDPKFARLPELLND